jgi:hypothetical protein
MHIHTIAYSRHAFYTSPRKLIVSQFSSIGLIPIPSSIMPAICYTYYKLAQPSTLCSHL